MKLYGVPLSVHTRKVQLALRIKGIDHDLHVVIPIMPDTLPENWNRLSPTGLIPVIEDGDFTLPDSGAIIQYLDAKYPETPLVPIDPQLRGRTVWFEAYLGAFFREVMHPLFHQRVVAPMRDGVPDTEVTDHALTDIMPRYFQYLEGEVEGEWLAGETITVADIFLGANLVLFAIWASLFPPSAIRHCRAISCACWRHAPSSNSWRPRCPSPSSWDFPRQILAPDAIKTGRSCPADFREPNRR